MTKKKSESGISGKTTSKARTATGDPQATEPLSASQLQYKAYERAVGLFSKGSFPEARDCFLDAARGPAPHISDKARSYVQVCERRTANVTLELHTAEDHFNYGVERLNARDVDRAKHHLGRALLLDPRADYILYTMALCCGLAGDGDGAYENLRLAIELEPRNRILARQDPEFAALVLQLPVLRPLLSAEPSV